MGGLFCGLFAGRKKRSQKTKTSRATKIRIAKFAATLFFPIFLETLDYTVVAIAQSDIASSFGRLDLQTYIGTVYTLTASVFLPIFAPFARTYGNHFSLQTSLFLFCLGSALCTAAQNITMVLAGRGIAGIGAAGLLATSRIILISSLTGEDRHWQLRLVLWLYFPGFVAGPVVGGALTTINFRWIFAINLPCCVLSSILSFFLLRDIIADPEKIVIDPTFSRKKAWFYKFLTIDWIGAVLFVVGGICVLLGLNFGSTQSWTSIVTLVALPVGAFVIAACVYWEYVLERFHKITSSAGYTGRALKPPFQAEALLPLDLFRTYDTVVAFFMTSASGMILFVVFYFTSIYYTIVLGLSTTLAGLQTLFFVPGLLIGTQISGRIVRRLQSPKLAACLGGFILTLSVGLVSYAVDDGIRSQLDGFVVLVGVGTGLCTNSLQIYLRQSQPASAGPVVATLFLFFRSFGGTIGLVQCSTILNAKVSANIRQLSLTADPSTATSLHSLDSSSIHSLADIDNLPAGVQAIVREAFGNSVRFCFLSIVPWLGVGFFLMCFATNNRGRFEQRMERLEMQKRNAEQGMKDMMEEEDRKKTAAEMESGRGSQETLVVSAPGAAVPMGAPMNIIRDSMDVIDMQDKPQQTYAAPGNGSDHSLPEQVPRYQQPVPSLPSESTPRLGLAPQRRSSTPKSANFAVNYL